MKGTKRMLAVAVTALVVTLAGCSGTPKAPDVKANIRSALDEAALKNVSVAQDRDKGVITLDGHVASDSEKVQAESIARSFASGQVVANQIAVLPPGSQGVAKRINSALDNAIEKNLDAALLQNSLHDTVKYDVTNGVVTLTGEVNSEEKRNAVQVIASHVPNVEQVVNKIDVPNQRATSTR